MRAARRGRFVATRLLQALSPQACALCNGAAGAALLCSACRASLPRVQRPCRACALPAPDGEEVCGACRGRPPPFWATHAAWVYAFPVDRLVQALKYHGRLAYAEPLADALARAVAGSRAAALPDAVVALPLSRSRQRERGFNQAHEIALRVASALGVPLVAGLARARDAPPQATLAWSARAANVRGAFVGHPRLAGRRIAIVDDVMTTGATLAEAAGAARRAGATSVQAWVVARTLPPDA